MKQLSETCRKPRRNVLIKCFSYLLLFFSPALFSPSSGLGSACSCIFLFFLKLDGKLVNTLFGSTYVKEVETAGGQRENVAGKACCYFYTELFS